MVVSEGLATAQATQSSDVYARRGGAWAGEADGVDSIAQTFKIDPQQRISLMELMNRISATGIGTDDPRVREMVADPSDADGRDGGRLTMKQFSAACEASGGLIARALRGDLVVPDFARLQRELQEMYASVRVNRGGAVADYIPQLKGRSREVRNRGLHGRRAAVQHRRHH